MRYALALLVLTASIFFSTSFSFAASPNSLESAIAKAEAQQLWLHPTWLNLLFYEHSLSGYSSKVTSTDFFMTDDGRRSPKSELMAALAVIYSGDTQRRCRFIARTDWLIDQLQLTEGVTNTECHAFQDWAKPEQTTSISLIFATGYFGNPASYYGHSLIKFNQQTAGQGLNDTVINFGAETPDNENPLVYISKGVFGGYQAQFSDGRLYEHETMYGQIELRDLWVYELNLSYEQQLLLQKHLWELNDQRFRYFFTRENCAYYIARAIENASERTFVSQHPGQWAWVIPINGFIVLAEQGLVRSIDYIPSRSSQLTAEFDMLSKSEKRQLTTLAAADFENFEEVLITSPVSERFLRASITYTSYMISYDKERQSDWRAIRQRLIVHRYTLPPSRQYTDDHAGTHHPIPPHTGDRPSKAALSVWQQSNIGTGLTLTLRAANTDLLSKPQGRIPYSKLEMLKVEADMTADSIRLHQLTLVDIISPNISRTGLKGDGGYSWKVSAAVAPYDFACNACLTLRTSGGIGKTVDFDHAALYGYITGRANTAFREQSTLSAGVDLGYLYQGSESLYMLFDIRYLKGLDRAKTEEIAWAAEFRFLNSERWDNRLKVEHEGKTRISLELGYSF